MPSITIRNLSEDAHRALKLRAAKHGRSMEAEIRNILETAATQMHGVGSSLAAIGRHLGDIELDLQRDPCLVDPAQLK